MASVKSTLGLEVEFILINENGQVTFSTDKIIERLKKTNPDALVIPEIAENMLEFGSEPSVKVSESAESLLENMNLAVKAASEEKTLLLPMSTYPAAFEPKMRDKGLYLIKKKLFGLQFPITGRCVGYHLHHALPEGSFDATSKNLKATLGSKTKRSLVEAYNFTVALDPVLTTFMQSSPFYQGKHLGKDSRMIVYRGGRVMGYSSGLYAGHLEKFGDLPGYKMSDSELLDMVVENYASWKKTIREMAPETLEGAKYESILETNWNPVKINPHGTIEIRGMDMNFPSLVFSTAVVVKYLFQDIYENSLHILPSDEGVAEYFKEEKGTLFVPPDDYVRNKLQYLSAYLGMDNDSVHTYCTSFLKLAKRAMPASARKLILPFQKMVEEKETVSDMIMKKAKKLGYSEGEEIDNATTRELVLSHASEFLTDLEKTQKLVEKFKNV